MTSASRIVLLLFVAIAMSTSAGSPGVAEDDEDFAPEATLPAHSNTQDTGRSSGAATGKDGSGGGHPAGAMPGHEADVDAGSAARSNIRPTSRPGPVATPEPLEAAEPPDSAAPDREPPQDSSVVPAVTHAPAPTPTETPIRTKTPTPTPSPVPAPAAPPAANGLTIASWGGAYQRSQEIAFIDPFRRETGIAVKMVGQALDVSGRQAEGASAPAWDVADMPAYKARKACARGDLAPISAAKLVPASDGGGAAEDFLAGGLSKCAVASVVWSSVIAIDPKQVGKRADRLTLGDIFALPGAAGLGGKVKVALPRRPRYLLELALMAGGVAPDQVYNELSSEAGLKRAFAIIERIRDRIVWWDRADQPMKYLLSGRVGVALAFNGRAFMEMALSGRKLDLLWQGQIYDTEVWVIAKAAKNRKAAMDFIAFATRPDRLAEQARRFPYGPMRRSAIRAVGRHPDLGLDMAAFLPTTPANRTLALALNHEWWLSREARLTERLENWIANAKRPAGETGRDAGDGKASKTETAPASAG